MHAQSGAAWGNANVDRHSIISISAGVQRGIEVSGANLVAADNASLAGSSSCPLIHVHHEVVAARGSVPETYGPFASCAQRGGRN